MAPYISSHLCDSVWVAHLPSAQLDILQNLVANTRMTKSAMTQLPAICCPLVVDCAQLRLRPAPNKGSVLWLIQAGP